MTFSIHKNVVDEKETFEMVMHVVCVTYNVTYNSAGS